MLKVIGAGLPRTGTTSLKAALERLGFGPCYHMFELLSHPEHVDKWLPAAEGTPLDWEHVLDGYRSTQDWPASHFWREQAAAYPDAKVILTVRDPHRWYASFRTLLSQEFPQEDVPEALRPVIDASVRLGPVLDAIGRDVFGLDADRPLTRGVPEEERAVEAFRRHTAMVTESLPADRLLVFDVREGWGPLCAFLGVEPPADEAFPHLNDSAMLQRTFERAMTEGRIASPFDSAG
jgi:hypothetical protein